jgi:ParB/RepB/Spo0J family partition protein
MTTTATLTTELVGIPHAKLHPAPDNLRGTLTDVDDLAQSIAEAGLLQPLRVTPHPDRAGQWIIIAGHRRHAAIGRLIDAGRWRKTQPIACIHDGTAVDDQARVQAMLIENLQRVDLDPIEEANGYQRLANEFGMSVRAIADKVGRSKSVISARTTLLKLPESVRTAVSEGTVTLDVANKLTRLPAADAEKLAKAGKTISDWQVDEAIRRHTRTEFAAKVKTTAKTLGLEITKDPVWKLSQDGWTRLHDRITPDALAKVIIPGPGHAVTWDDYNLVCTVWAPPAPTDTTDTQQADTDQPASKAPITPLEQAQKDWRDRYSRLERSYHDTRTVWNERRHQLLVNIARELSTKDVAASALWFAASADGAMEVATDLGFNPEISDADSFEVFDEWLRSPANLTALAALVMLTAFEDVPIKQAANTRIDAELGPEPQPARQVLGYAQPYTIEAALLFYDRIGFTGDPVPALRAELAANPPAPAPTDDDGDDVDENAHLYDDDEGEEDL